MRQYVQERAAQCQSWLLVNLTAEQCAAFEEFITPPRSEDQKLADLKTAISIIERSGGDPSDVKRQIEEAETIKREASEVAVSPVEAESR